MANLFRSPLGPLLPFTLALVLLPGSPSDGLARQGGGAQNPEPRAAAATTVADAGLTRTLHVTITDERGRFIGGLLPNLIGVYEGKERLPVVSFSSAGAPASVGILFDMSGSMVPQKSKAARDGLALFLGESHPANEYFLVAFNQSPQLLQDVTRGGDAVLRALERLGDVKGKGQTAFYDACYLGVEKVTRGTRGKRVLLLLTDGQDNASRFKFSELRRLIRESDVIVYAVGLTNPEEDSTLSLEGRAILEELTGVTGGMAFYPATVNELQAALRLIALELRSQYVVGVSLAGSSAKKDGWRELKVKLATMHDNEGKPYKLHVRTREGFYVPAKPR